jgi:hypothetical protein
MAGFTAVSVAEKGGRKSWRGDRLGMAALRSTLLLSLSNLWPIIVNSECIKRYKKAGCSDSHL